MGQGQGHSVKKKSLIRENFNLANTFWTVSARAFIFHMSIPCDKNFPWVPLFLTLWNIKALTLAVWKLLARLKLSGAFVFHKHILFKNYICITAQSYFSILLLTPWKKMWPFNLRIWIPFTQGYSMPSLVEICQEIIENVSSLCVFFLPLGICMTLKLNKFKFYLPKNT